MPDAVWSGVPDALRRLVRAYGDARGSYVFRQAAVNQAEAALAAALRDLAQSHERLAETVWRLSEGR